VTDTNTSTQAADSADAPDTSAVETAIVAAGSLDELPEWAQNEIRRARSEAAKYRRERNTAQKALQDKDISAGDQKSSAEIDRLTSELHTARRDSARLRAALAADIPPTQVADFAARLVGDTDDELAADATRLRALLGLPGRRPDLSQGAGLDNPGAAGSPAEAFAAFVQDRLSK
jgi:hypothetical protein